MPQRSRQSACGGSRRFTAVYAKAFLLAGESAQSKRALHRTIFLMLPADLNQTNEADFLSSAPRRRSLFCEVCSASKRSAGQQDRSGWSPRPLLSLEAVLGWLEGPTSKGEVRPFRPAPGDAL
jgi:hypothetical protein